MYTHSPGPKMEVTTTDLLNTTWMTSQGSSNIHTSHSEMEIEHPEGQILHEVITIPEGSSDFDMQRIGNPSNEISMMSMMSVGSEPSNNHEISMISINENMSIGSDPSSDPQIAMKSIFKNLQKIKKILLEKKALKDLQMTPV